MSNLFDDEDQYSEHDIAWMSKDWDAVQAIADSYKEKPENEVFSILNDINSSKQDRCVAQSDNYSKFYIDNALSQHIDCIQAVYMSNLVMQGMPDQAHFNYLLHAVPQGKRYGKWAKLTENVKEVFIIKLLMKFYKINNYDAIMYKDILTRKGKLKDTLARAKSLVDDQFLKSITKNVKEQKELRNLL